MTVAADDPGLEDTLGDVSRWFFDDYLSRWMSVVNGTCQEGPEFILDYWGCPLHVSSRGMNRWLTEPQDVTGLLAGTQARLREAGYTHTAVLDSRVTVFHPGGVAIEVIWSRRAGETEIERRAVHFQAVRNQDGWRVIGIQEIGTTAQSLDELWPIHRGQHRDRGSPRGSSPAPQAGGIRTTGRLPSWTQRQQNTGFRRTAGSGCTPGSTGPVASRAPGNGSPSTSWPDGKPLGRQRAGVGSPLT